jgi:hypothetical protein
MKIKEYKSFEIVGSPFKSLELFNEFMNKNIIDTTNELKKTYSGVKFVEFYFYSTTDRYDDEVRKIDLTFERDYTESELKILREKEEQDRLNIIRQEENKILQQKREKECRRQQYLKLKEEFEV